MSTDIVTLRTRLAALRSDTLILKALSQVFESQRQHAILSLSDVSDDPESDYSKALKAMSDSIVESAKSINELFTRVREQTNELSKQVEAADAE